MPRTTIPAHLIHRLDEVERNAQLFDELCRQAEKAAFPVVRSAVVRETTTTGAEVLTSEAKLALQGLVNDAELEGFEDEEILDQVRRSLESEILPPDENEFRALARDAAQVLMSAWLEMLRGAVSKMPLLVLSDRLLESTPSSFGAVTRFILRLKKETTLPPSLSDVLVPFAVNDHEVGEILKTLRTNLFPNVRVVDLPFELVIVGAPTMPVLAMTRPNCEALLLEFRYRTAPATSKKEVGPFASAKSGAAVSSRQRRFSSAHASRSVAAETNGNLSQDQYTYFSQKASGVERVEKMEQLTR